MIKKPLLFVILLFIVLSLYAQNQPPVAQNDTYNINTNSTLNVAAPGVLANDSDPESTVLRVNPVPFTNTTNGSLTLNTDGSFTNVPNTNYIGSDSFVYEVCDSGIDDLVSQFDFDAAPLTNATVGPNATSINPNAVQTGCGIRIPSGSTGGSVGLDVVVPNTSGIFDFTSFRVFFTYRDNESQADILTGGNFRIYHITGNQLGVIVTVISSATGLPTTLTLTLGNFFSNYNDYIVEYDEVTGDIIYTRNGVVVRTEIAPDNSPLDVSLATSVTVGRNMDNAGNANPSLCNIGIVDTSKLCDTATVTLNVTRATLITNRSITYRVNRTN